MTRVMSLIILGIVLCVSVSAQQKNSTIADTITCSLAGKTSGLISCQSKTEGTEFRIGGPGCPGCQGLLRTSPLILIDGLEVSSDVLARLNPNDIKSFFVISDAKEALELYGTRGVNGVIVISSNLKKKDLKKMIKGVKNNNNKK